MICFSIRIAPSGGGEHPPTVDAFRKDLSIIDGKEVMFSLEIHPTLQYQSEKHPGLTISIVIRTDKENSEYENVRSSFLQVL